MYTLSRWEVQIWVYLGSKYDLIMAICTWFTVNMHPFRVYLGWPIYGYIWLLGTVGSIHLAYQHVWLRVPDTAAVVLSVYIAVSPAIQEYRYSSRIPPHIPGTGMLHNHHIGVSLCR